MAKKYNKINAKQIIKLFENKEVINTEYIKSKLNCSRYSVIRIIEELTEDKKIRLTNYGYIKLNNN